MSQCIDSLLANCDDSTKAIARYDIELYQSMVLGDECDITSDALDAVPEVSLVECMEVMTSRQINNTEDVCNAVGDYVDCVRYSASIILLIQVKTHSKATSKLSLSCNSDHMFMGWFPSFNLYFNSTTRPPYY